MCYVCETAFLLWSFFFTLPTDQILEIWLLDVPKDESFAYRD
jgi:hypothetical protein